MGIPGILKEIGKGERVALAKLAVEHLERTQRPLRIAIDAAIWNFQSQAGQGGKNPALRTLYYRLLKILALPIHPLFVYDGKNKPFIKRGRTVARWGSCIANETSKKLLQQFRYPYHVAPGEAEAECALLQKNGLVDMVMSQDGDAIMFGSNVTLRDWSKEGTKGNKSPTHVNLLDLRRIKERSGLDPDGMILVALLSGGDYDQDGVPGFGPALACEVARAGFGEDLLELMRNDDEVGLSEWRERLQYELESNASGYFKRKHKTLKVPETFPNRTLLSFYTHPAVSKEEDLNRLEQTWIETWDTPIDISEMRAYAGQTFDWLYKPGAWKFIRGMAPSLLAHKLRLGLAHQYVNKVEQISERRQHFISDGIPELRITTIPVDVVGLDLDAEEDSPEYLERLAAEQAEETIDDVDAIDGEQLPREDAASSQSPSKPRKTPAWRPTDPEKMWVPETLVKLGVPALVEDWEQIQRDILADPKKFATRKLKSTKPKATPAVSRPIYQFFEVSKPVERPVLKGLHLSHPEARQVRAEPSMSNHSSEMKASRQIQPTAVLSTQFATLSMQTVQARKEPLTPRKSREITRLCTQELGMVELPSSVTSRRRRAAAKKSRASSSDNTSPLKPSRPIESFFIAAAAEAKKNPLSKGLTTTEKNNVILPSDPSTGLHTALLPNHIFAAPRDSLPGSWKLLDLDEEIISTKSKRRTRISYVNMAEG